MALIRVTRTVLIEQVLVIDCDCVLFPLGSVMEDGEPFEQNVILIEKENDFEDDYISVIEGKALSKPVIIKIEQV